MGTVSPAPARPTRSFARPIPLSRASDEWLARQATRGDEHAFAALFERYHQQVYRYCRSIVRNDTDAQDVLQSTFMAALAALQRQQRSAPLKPWLFRIAHNESISLLRRRRRDSGPELEEIAEPAAASVEEEASVRERLAQLIADLAELPDRQRGALLLRELSGLAHEEIAIALGTTAGAAKQSIFEARQALAEFAEGRAMPCEDVQRRISDGDGRSLRGRRMRAHLRGCAQCSSFAAAIPSRREDLQAIVPLIAPAAAAGVLAHTLGGATANGGGALAGSAASGSAASSAAASGASASPASGAGATAAATAAGKTAGLAIAWKAAATVAVIAAAGAGTVAAVLPHHSAATHGTRVHAAGTRSAGGSRGASGGRQTSGSGASTHGGAIGHGRASASERGGGHGRSAAAHGNGSAGSGAVSPGQSASATATGKSQSASRGKAGAKSSTSEAATSGHRKKPSSTKASRGRHRRTTTTSKRSRPSTSTDVSTTPQRDLKK